MNWFNALTLREKILLLALLPVALIAMAYQIIWTPLSLQRAAYSDLIASYRLVTQTAELAQQSAPLTVTQPAVAQNDTPLPVRITRSGEASGIILQRIESDGAGVRVSLADTSFAQLTLWLADLEQTDKVVVTAIEIDRRPEPGIISARILFEDL